MFIHNIDPALFSIGPFQIMYYGLFYAIGFIMAYFLISYLAKKKELPLTKDDVADYILYVLVGTVLGARIFYVLFYNLPSYLSSPAEIIAVWHGGLSFHGGLIGAIIAGLYFCRKKKISFYELADITVIPLALGLALGRIGNFINGELVGRITNISWCIDYSQNQFIPEIPEGCRHPSQIYASFKNLIIFFALLLIKEKNLPKGFMFWLFVVMYSTLRFIVEFFRQPDKELGFILGSLTMGQILSILMFAIGLFFIYKVSKKAKTA